MTSDEFEKQLTKHEGIVLHPYKDSVGKLTIGIGRNLDDRGISKDEAIYLLHNDIEIHARELAQHFPIVNDLDTVRYYTLVNMCFNLGIVRLASFKKMWGNISVQNWKGAAEEMLDSKWHSQVGARAEELALQMETGEFYG